MNDNPISFFDTACAVVLAETETMMRRVKTGRQIVAEIRACETVEDVEAWIEAETHRRQIGETL